MWTLLLIFACQRLKYADTGGRDKILRTQDILYGWPLQFLKNHPESFRSCSRDLFEELSKTEFRFKLLNISDPKISNISSLKT